MKKSIYTLLVVSFVFYSCGAEEETSAAPSNIVQTPEQTPTQYSLTVTAGDGVSCSFEQL